jgi:hypothetical protein
VTDTIAPAQTLLGDTTDKVTDTLAPAQTLVRDTTDKVTDTIGRAAVRGAGTSLDVPPAGEPFAASPSGASELSGAARNGTSRLDRARLADGRSAANGDTPVPDPADRSMPRPSSVPAPVSDSSRVDSGAKTLALGALLSAVLLAALLAGRYIPLERTRFRSRVPALALRPG